MSTISTQPIMSSVWLWYDMILFVCVSVYNCAVLYLKCRIRVFLQCFLDALCPSFDETLPVWNTKQWFDMPCLIWSMQPLKVAPWQWENINKFHDIPTALLPCTVWTHLAEVGGWSPSADPPPRCSMKKRADQNLGLFFQKWNYHLKNQVLSC